MVLRVRISFCLSIQQMVTGGNISQKISIAEPLTGFLKLYLGLGFCPFINTVDIFKFRVLSIYQYSRYI